MQQVTLLGYVGRDPESRTVAGKPLKEFSLGCSAKVNGESQTTWYKVTHWGQNDGLYAYIKKGTQLCVTGSLSLQTYTSKQGKDAGKEIAQLCVNCQSIHFAGKQGDSNTTQPKQDQPETSNTTQGDDLPF